MNDLGGERPFDLMYSGQDALIVAEMNRLNLANYWGMANRSSPNLLGPAVDNRVAGTDVPGDTGTLLATEGQTYSLWVVFPHSAKPAYQFAANGALVPAYRFFAVTLEGPDDLDIGMQPLKIHMVWHAIRTWVAGIGGPNGINTGTFSLYDNNAAGLPPPA